MISITPLSPTVGAEIGGVDLNTIDDAQFAEVHRALLDWGAIFFRDQDLEPEAQLAFAGRFGTIEIYPFKKGNRNFSPHPSGLEELVRLNHDEDNPGVENAWHSDVTWMVEPSLGSVLRAVELPDSGGDTAFSDCRAVYDSLDPRMADWLGELTAHHDWLRVFGTRLDPTVLAEFRHKHPGADHPVIRTHPESGRKVVYVNGPFTEAILGLDTNQGRALLQYLLSLIAVPEFQCRFTWEPGSVAMWDNRSVQHYAVSDYWPNRRVMDRVTIAGDKPY